LTGHTSSFCAYQALLVSDPTCAVLDIVHSDVPGAQYLDSSDYGSLRGGYWMIYYAGSFTDGQQALAYCAAHGLTTGNQCLGRFVSHSPADRTDMCFPPAASPTGDCTAP